jgi:sodium/bile acid cotransporter 7
MANIIFAGQAVGAIVLPMMIYHQMQLILCAFLARAYAVHRAAQEPDPVQA